MHICIFIKSKNKNSIKNFLLFFNKIIILNDLHHNIYVFTFISFESILGITNGLISTPVEEGPVERITEGLQRGGKTRWKLFYIQIFTCLAGLSCPESQRNGIMFVFGLVPRPCNCRSLTFGEV